MKPSKAIENYVDPYDLPGSDLEIKSTDGGWVAEPEQDPVNNPSHYTAHPSGVECIEVTRHLSFNLGNAIKYIWRADEKGKAIQDLEKAVWYLNDEIARRKNEQI